MILSIENATSSLLGLCFLQEAERDVVKELWLDAFPKSETAWVEASVEDEKETLLEKILQAFGNTAMAGKSCTVALFLDARVPVTAEQLETLSSLAGMVESAHFCTVPVEMQFVYLGRNPEMQPVALRSRDYVEALTRSNDAHKEIMKRACLVACPLPDPADTRQWEGVIFYLDLLRRSTVHEVLPTVGSNGNDDVCFLRWGGYDAERKEALAKRVEELKRSLSDFGAKELQMKLSNILLELEEQIHKTLPLDCTKQPIDPNMYVQGFIKEKLAAKGKNDEFNAAQTSTRNALLETAKEYQSTIEALYLAMLGGDAKAYLLSLFREVGIGLKLEEDRSGVTMIFDSCGQTPIAPRLPALAYRKDGYLEEIGTYFSQVQSYALAKGRESFLKSLAGAYGKIDDEEIRKRKGELEKQLRDAQNEFAAVPGEEEFLAGVSAVGQVLHTNFHPNIPGGGATAKLVVDDLEENAAKHDAETPPDVNVIFLNGSRFASGGKMHTKAVHVLSFDCSQQRLNDLIRGV